ncbi:MAG: hypothetical protein JXO44_07620 [Clostridia bacterium]|nr:hypothetical protein [Clostridia bacterium]
MKKYFTTLLIAFAFVGSFAFAEDLKITIGIDNCAPTMKPVPIQILNPELLEEGDTVILEQGDRAVILTLSEKEIRKDTPITSTLFITDTKTPIHYEHKRGNQTISRSEVICHLSDQEAVGALSDFVVNESNTEKAMLYALKPQMLSSQSILDMLDVIYIDNFYTDRLSEDEVNTLLEWVAKGGTILVQKDKTIDRTYSGFLSDMQGIDHLDYGFGLIANISDLMVYVNEHPTRNNYPGVNVNNYRSIAKNSIHLDSNAARMLLIIVSVFTILGLFFIWLPKCRDTYRLAGYFLLPVFCFIILNVIYTRPLASLTTIQWETGDAKRVISCLHSVERGQNASHVLGNHNVFLTKTASEDEQTEIIYSQYFDPTTDRTYECDLTLDQNHVTGNLSWYGKTTLDKSAILIGDALIPIGTMLAGQTITLDYQLNPPVQPQKPYDRQMAFVKQGHWSMDESLLFNEYQNWYLASNDFKWDQPLLLGFEEGEGTIMLENKKEVVKEKIMTVKTLDMEGGVSYE